MAHRRLHRSFRELAGDLEDRLSAADLTTARAYMEYGEEKLGVDLLAAMLVVGRVPVSRAERARLDDLLGRFGSADSRYEPYVYNRSATVAALIVDGEPFRPRGVGPLRGGHLHGSGRRGATEFPPGWDAAGIEERARSVVADPAGEAVRLANGRSWCAGVHDGVEIGIVSETDARLRCAFPLNGPGVGHNPAVPPRGPHDVTLSDSLVDMIFYRSFLPDRAAPAAEAAAYEGLLDAGEWDELADVIAARFALDGVDLTVTRDGSRLRTLLNCFDLPVEGCDFLNDRDRLLTLPNLTGPL